MTQQRGGGLFRRVRKGVFVGTGYATLLSVIAVVISVVAPESLARVHLSTYQVVLVYYLGGVVGGAIASAFISVTRTRLGAFLLGFATMVPLTTSASLLRGGGRDFWPVGLIAAVIASAVVGGGLGVVFRDDKLR